MARSKKGRETAAAVQSTSSQPHRESAAAGSSAVITTVDRLPADASPDYFYDNYFLKHKPCVIPKVASSWPACKKWDLDTMESIVVQHADVETVELVRYEDGSKGIANGGHYVDMRLNDFREYFSYLRKVGGPGAHGPQRAALKNGVNIPRQAVAADCPVPEILASLHRSGHLRVRDMMGRKAVRFFISSKGFHSRCHFDRFGYSFFTVQVRGAKTWYLYEPNAVPLERQEAFDNAPVEDFTRGEVQRKYGAMVADVGPGDMLYLPPFTYHSVQHEAKWNVHLDFACLPDKVWAERNKGLPLAMQDVGGMLGGRILLCFGLPQLLGEQRAVRRLRSLLFEGAFAEEEAALVQRAILAKDGPDDIDHVLRTAVLSASGAGMDALVLESCIACKAALPDAYSVLCALSLLGYQLQTHQGLAELAANVDMFKSQAMASLGLSPLFLALDVPEGTSIKGDARRALADAAAWTKSPPRDCAPDAGHGGIPDGPVENMILELVTAIDRIRATMELTAAVYMRGESAAASQETAAGAGRAAGDTAPKPHGDSQMSANAAAPEAADAEGTRPQPCLGMEDPDEHAVSKPGRPAMAAAPIEPRPIETEDEPGPHATSAALSCADVGACNGQLASMPMLEAATRVMCSWAGCRSSEHLQDILVCSQCKRTQYCSAQCQAAHWGKGHSEDCKPRNEPPPRADEACSNHQHKDPATDAPAEPIDPTSQPELPDLKMTAPFTEDKLSQLVPEIKSWARHLAQHYVNPRPAGQGGITLPAAFVLRKEGSGGLLRPVFCEMEAGLDQLSVSTRWAIVDHKGVAAWTLAKVAKGSVIANGSWPMKKGVLAQLCSARTNMSFFLEEGPEGILGPPIGYPTDASGPLLVIEQLQTALDGSDTKMKI